MGGIARVGMSSVSLANIAVSDRSPFDRLMSDTCGARRAGNFAAGPRAHAALVGLSSRRTEMLYLTARPASVSSLETCTRATHQCVA